MEKLRDAFDPFHKPCQPDANLRMELMLNISEKKNGFSLSLPTELSVNMILRNPSFFGRRVIEVEH
jgi:hypothetical protein